MQIIKLTYPIQDSLDFEDKVVLAMGFFDGLHKGQQEVIRQAKLKAKELRVKLAVLTYDHHPKLVYKKMTTHESRYLTLYDYKMKLFESYGVDEVFYVNYSWKFQNQTPEEFVKNYLMRFNAVAVVAGFDHTYGHKDVAVMENLPKFSNNSFQVITVPPVKLSGEKISSTRIRQALDAGNVDLVDEMIGRPFRTEGVIVHGEERGRLLGYPTANVKHDGMQWLPAIGIYIVTVKVANKKFLGMASIGKNVTFTDSHPMTTEINLLNFDDNIYGENVEVDWYSHRRNEIKFKTADQLIDQLAKDKKDALDYLKSHPEILN